jgi:hypothetical protein
VTSGPAQTAAKPSRPAISSVTPGHRRVTVTWRKPADNGGRPVTRYRLVCGTKTLLIGAATTRATIAGLPARRKVRVAISARNAVGWSAVTHSRYVTTRR